MFQRKVFNIQGHLDEYNNIFYMFSTNGMNIILQRYSKTHENALKSHGLFGT